jgi:hypothetical protein
MRDRDEVDLELKAVAKTMLDLQLKGVAKIMLDLEIKAVAKTMLVDFRMSAHAGSNQVRLSLSSQQQTSLKLTTDA